ncbi:hypothetical protein BCR44DRAFT_1440901 [Catenaria anguillulae PL171]|uniref:Uncharacterized protein n=1 Tax=Catenaria anguillulae PL171 TaxID=765915 RepID=A0A1Y2HDT5_9FUNG|nr:hypothetical protein BCR44DRAFT_1440901 [Catenaria anguillulae PL171]
MLRVPSHSSSSSTYRSPAAPVSTSFAIPSSCASSTHSISPAMSVSSVSTSSSSSSSSTSNSSTSATGPRYVTHAVLARGPNSAAAALAIVSMGDIVLARSPAGVEYAIVRSLLVDATGSAWFRRQPLVARVVNSSMQFFPASSSSSPKPSLSSSRSPAAGAAADVASAGDSATWEPLGLIVRVVYSSKNGSGNPPSVNVASVPSATRTPSTLVPQKHSPAQVSAAVHDKPSSAMRTVVAAVKDVVPGLGSKGTPSSSSRALAAANVFSSSSSSQQHPRPPVARGHVTPALPIALMNPTLRRLSGLGPAASGPSSIGSSSSSSSSLSGSSSPSSSSSSIPADPISRFHPYARPSSNSPNSTNAAAAVAIAAAAIRRLPTPTPSPASAHDPLASRQVTTPLALGPPAMVIPTSPPATPSAGSAALSRARSWSQTQAAPTSALAMPALTVGNGNRTPALVVSHDRPVATNHKSSSQSSSSTPSIPIMVSSPDSSSNSPLVLRPTTPPPFELTEAALSEPASTAPRSLTMTMTIVDAPKPPNKYTRPANFVLPRMPAAPICPRTSGPGSLAYIVTTSRGCLTEIAEAVSAEEEEQDRDQDAMDVDREGDEAAAQVLLQLARAPVRA